MSNFSRGLLAATLTGSLALSGTTVASANDCGAPSAKFTASVEGKEHTFKKVSEFLWQATDDENVTLNRADIFELAKDGADVCSSEPIDLDDWGTGNNDSGSESDEREDDDADSGKDGDDANSDKDGGDANSDKDGDDADSGKDGGDADSGKDGDDANSDKDKDDQNKDKKSSFKDALSSEDGKPSGLGIAAIVISVLGALAAAAPHAARALGIKLPF